MNEIKREHVEQAVADLTRRGLLADTSPDLPDGRRSADRWLAAVREDAGIIHLQLEESLLEGSDKARCLRVALKEAARLQSDIYRFANEVLGMSRQEVDEARKGL